MDPFPTTYYILPPHRISRGLAIFTICGLVYVRYIIIIIITIFLPSVTGLLYGKMISNITIIMFIKRTASP